MVKVCKPNQEKKCIKLHTIIDGKKTSKAKIDILGNLPREIVFKILINLTREDIDSAVKCCGKWRQVMSYEFFWKLFYKKEYFDFEEEPDTEFYHNNLCKFSSHWQGRYMYNRMFQYNVESKMYISVSVHLNAPRDALVYFDDRMLILTANSNLGKKIVIIDSCTGLIEKELLFSLEYVKVIKHENLLIAITQDFHLKVWDIDSCKCIINVEMDNNSDAQAFRLLACKHLIFIAGLKYFVPFFYVFNMETQKFSFLGKHLCLFCTNDIIAIAERNGIVELFNTNLKSLAKFNCFKAKALIQITMNPDFLVKVYENLRDVCYASVWNIKTKANFRIRMKSTLDLYYLNLTGNVLVCQTDSNRCEVWDLHAQNRCFKIDTNKAIKKIVVLSNRYMFLYFDSLSTEIYCIQKCALIKKHFRYNRDSYVIASTKTKMLKRKRERFNWNWNILNFETTLD